MSLDIIRFIEPFERNIPLGFLVWNSIWLLFYYQFNMNISLSIKTISKLQYWMVTTTFVSIREKNGIWINLVIDSTVAIARRNLMLSGYCSRISKEIVSIWFDAEHSDNFIISYFKERLRWIGCFYWSAVVVVVVISILYRYVS